LFFQFFADESQRFLKLYLSSSDLMWYLISRVCKWAIGVGANMTFCKLLVAAIAALFVTGCQLSPGMVDETLAYNQAIAMSTDQLLLLNAVRAAKRYPTYYSRTTQNTASTTLTPSMTIASPLEIFNSLSKHTGFGVSAALQHQLTLQNLDDQKFIRGMMQPVSLGTIDTFSKSGWPNEVLLDMFVREIEVDKAHYPGIMEAFDTFCASELRADNLYCRVLKAPTSYPSQSSQPLSNWHSCFTASWPTSTSGDNRHLQNNPAATNNRVPQGRPSYCFRVFVLVSLAFGIHIESNPVMEVVYRSIPNDVLRHSGILIGDTKGELIVVPTGRATSAVCHNTTKISFAFSKDAQEELRKAWATLPKQHGPLRNPPQTQQPDEAQSATYVVVEAPPTGKPAPTCGALANAPSTDTDGPTIKFSMRSVEAMVYYLGEIIRAQMADGTQRLYVLHWDATDPLPPDRVPVYEEELFHVDTDGNSSSAVRVEDGDIVYSIPPACRNEKPSCLEQPTNESLEVLNLINQVWGLQKEQTDVVTAPPVTIINP
jgi:hypothetical protein